MHHLVINSGEHYLLIIDLGDVFGWGNTEYCQISTLDNCQQIAVPTHIRMCKKLGKIIDVAAGGTFCLVLNGKKSNNLEEILLI